MAGRILPFFAKWTTIVSPNVHSSDAFEMTGDLTILTDVQVSGLIAGPLNMTFMESMDGQYWMPRLPAIPCPLGYTPLGPYTATMRFVRLDAQGAGAGTIASFFATGVARDA